MKKTVVEVWLCDEECKRKAMKKVATLTGVDSISVEMKDQKMTVIGEVDPICIAQKLRKFNGRIVSVEPAKEEKKDEKKDPEVTVTVAECINYMANAQSHWVEVPYADPYHHPSSCVIC